MEKVRKISKKYYVRQIVACWMVTCMLFAIPAQVARATVSGGVFKVGAGTIKDGITDSTVEVNQLESVIEWGGIKDKIGWGGIDTTKDESLSFSQVNGLSNSAVLNRIMSGNTTQFDGALNGADMRIFIVNQAGIVFGCGARINVSQLVASGLNMSNDAFKTAVNNVNEKMVFSGAGGSGDVTIFGTLDATGTDSLYFVGENVYKWGAIICPDGLVVMAAGDEMQLGQPGSDVIVQLADLTADADNRVWNDGGGVGGIGDDRVRKLVLAAGDVWSMAIDKNVEQLAAVATENVYFDGNILTYDDGGSDAVADITIITGGDFYVNSQITATAEAPTGFNSNATVTIESTDGSVFVNDNVAAEADADENGAGNATATVDISADEDVTINDCDDYAVEACAWVDKNSGNATANLNITTTDGNVNIYDDVRAEADTRGGSGNAISKAEINAGGDVDINEKFKARSEAVDSGNATADTKITGEYINNNGGKIVARAITKDNIVNLGDAEGNIVITARGNLDIDNGMVKSKVSSVGAGDATSDIKISGVDIDINNYIISRAQAGFHYTGRSGEYNDYSGNSGDATAGIDIAASGIVTVNNVVKSRAEAGDNSGSADATTKIVGTEINITGGGGGDELSVSAKAGTWENSGNATANVEIEATTGNVIIDNDGYPVIAEALVEDPDTDEYEGNAMATVDIDAGGNVEVIADNFGEQVGITASASGGTNNTANVTIGDDSENSPIGGNVTVTATDGGKAWIESLASDADNNNTANINIDADGDVELTAKNGGEALIKANAYDGTNNTANVDITASIDCPECGDEDDGHVVVHSIGGYQGDVFTPSHASIEAVAENHVFFEEVPPVVSNDADVVINADAYVWVTGESGGEAEISAIAKNGIGLVWPYAFEDGSLTLAGHIKNDADVEINATNIEVIALGTGSGPSLAEIEAIAKNEIYIVRDPDAGGPVAPEALELDLTLAGHLENNADVTITSSLVDVTSDVYEEDYEGRGGDGDVLLIAENGGKADIEAEAKNTVANYWPLDKPVTLDLAVSGLVENNADVVIDAADDVEVTADGYGCCPSSSVAEILALAENEVIDHGFSLPGDGSWPGDGEIVLPGQFHTATVHLTVTGDVENNAGIDIDADDDVEVEGELGGIARIEAAAENVYQGHVDLAESHFADLPASLPGNVGNSAIIGIDAGSNVEVSASDEDRKPLVNGLAEIEAKTKYATNNTADVTINAGCDVLVEDIGNIVSEEHTGIKATSEWASNNNSADIEINAGRNVEVSTGYSGRFNQAGQAEIEATAQYALNNNNAGIEINAGGDVEVIGLFGGTAMIEALAHNFIDVVNWGIDTLQGLENIANINITATNVEVIGEFGGNAYIEADAHNHIDISSDSSALDLTINDLKNTAGVTITTTGVDEGPDAADGDGDVLVIGENGGEADIDAEAFNVIEIYYDPCGPPSVDLTVQGPLDNKADVVINADGDVAVHGLWGGEAGIDAEAQNMLTGERWYLLSIVKEQGPIRNNATVDITTGDTVEVKGIEGEAGINADAWNYDDDEGVYPWPPFPLDLKFPDVKDNTATILIDAGGDVIVQGGEVVGDSRYPGDAEIEALARYGVNNSATVDIDAVGDVRVKDIGGYFTAKIFANAKDAIKSNTANVLIGSIDDYVGGNVEVIAGEAEHLCSGGEAYIHAIAEKAIGDDADNGDEGENTARVEIFNDGDVEVTGVEGGHAVIGAGTQYAYTNTSDVLICTDSVLVQTDNMGECRGETAGIMAMAWNGQNNTANVGIGASGDGVEVIANNDGGRASIEAMAFSFGDPALSNDADVVICTNGGVAVIDEGGGETAEILAMAIGGLSNTADVGICADRDADGDGDVLVAADNGGSARIAADAIAYEHEVWVWDEELGEEVPVNTSATANVVVVSRAGSVGVVALSGSEAYIEAGAVGAYTNTADVGIAAGQELAPWNVPELEEPDVLPEDIDDLLDLLPPGNVVVYGDDGSEAGIEAYAENGIENTADTVVCAPGTVAVISDEGEDVYIWAYAGEDEDDPIEGDIDIATTQVYASDGYVSVDAWVGAETTEGIAEVENWSPGDPVPPSEEGATLILDDYSVRQDCPECPPCPICEEEMPPFGPAAALVQWPDLPLLLMGCPQLVQTAANELGVTAGAIQVTLGNALALNPTLQACDACATLIDAAGILRDEDGSRMAAMNQVFGALAPASAPFTPGMQASIATAFAGAAEGTQYASVTEYIDAFVQYYAVLQTDLGAPVDDPLAFVMSKYGAGVTGSDNANIAAFLASRLETGETFAQ